MSVEADLDLEAIVREAEAEQRGLAVDARVAELVDEYAGAIDELGHERAAAPRSRSACAGQALTTRLSEGSRRKFMTARVLERSLLDGDLAELDISPLVFLGCQIVEDHLRRMIVPGAEKSASLLIDALSDNGKMREILAAWSERQCPVTFGTLQIMMVALRRLAATLAPSAHPLAGSVGDGYFALLAQKRGFERSMGIIRERFRNPIAHALSDTALTEEDYRLFAQLLVGARSLEAWDVEGPTAGFGAAEGLLHHHLEYCL